MGAHMVIAHPLPFGTAFIHAVNRDWEKVGEIRPPEALPGLRNLCQTRHTNG
jgi:hypothetical protein